MLASIALVVVGGIAVTMVLLKQSRGQAPTEPAPPQTRARRRRLPPPPPGLPPLSQVPRPKDEFSATGPGASR